jgi:hypothetical protein
MTTSRQQTTSIGSTAKIRRRRPDAIDEFAATQPYDEALRVKLGYRRRMDGTECRQTSLNFGHKAGVDRSPLYFHDRGKQKPSFEQR